MSDLMLHGVLNMPLPDDPAELDIVTWMQFRERARQASKELREDADQRIREAIEAERERCARIVERETVSCCNAYSGESMAKATAIDDAGRCIVDAIRKVGDA